MSFVLLGILNSQAAGGGAPAGAYDLIETVTFAQDASGSQTVEFTNIPTGFQHLEIRHAGRHLDNGAGRPTRNLEITLNDDTGANYPCYAIYGNGSTSGSFSIPTRDHFLSGKFGNSDFGLGIVRIFDYNSTAKYTTMTSETTMIDYRDPIQSVDFSYGSWQNTSAVSKISLSIPTYGMAAGTRISLYGLGGED